MLSLLTALTLAGSSVIDRGGLASQLSTEPVEVRYDAHGRVSLIRGPMGPLGEPLQFLKDRAAPLGLRDDEVLTVLADDKVSDGTRHVRVGRTLNGIKVEFDQLRLHANPAGQVTSLEADTSALEGFVPGAPTIAPARAIALASGNYQGRWEHPTQTDLVIVGSRFEGVTQPHLAWRVYVAFPAKPGKVPVIDHVYLDAHTGLEFARLSRVYTAGGTPITMTDTNVDGVATSIKVTQYSNGIALQDLATLSASQGVLYVVDGSNNASLYTTTSPTTSFGDRQAVSVSDFVSKATAFDLATFGWNKWNFTNTPSTVGGTLIGVTHVGNQMANAYFTTISSNGQTYGTMNYGDGDNQILLDPAKCLDVSGHEIGHGIVNGTADLAYHNQSGALNEHFADVFGWMLDSSNDTMGEKCSGPALHSIPLRDMCHPANGADPQPEKMSDYKTSPDTTEGDHGGVHVNSGIPNRAACLFRNASNFDTVGKVWFRTLSQHLGPTSSFAEMVQATQTSCTELGLGTPVCNALTNAWAGVGLAAATGGGGTCPPNSTPQGTQCVCNTGYHVNTAGTGCDADATVTCPANAHAVGSDCYCDAGYTLNSTGDGCVPSSSNAACGSHAHREGNSCACDECYQYSGSSSGESLSCVATPNCVVCTDPLKTGTSGKCVCVPGTTASGATCAPVLGNCGNENYAGRCNGSVLTYCNDVDSNGQPLPASQIQIVSGDCAANTTSGKTACGLTDVGYDCVVPTSNCGSVPSTGACLNNGSAQICDQGTLKTYQCGVNGCSTYTYKGVQFTFCNLCPPHATYNETADTCSCDTGYKESGTTCVSTGAGGGAGGGTGLGGGNGSAAGFGNNGGGSGSGGGGSTGCTSTSGELEGLALLVLFMLRRRS